MSLSEKLSQLLFIVPYVASRDGVPVDELAAKLGITPAQVVADVELLSMVGKPPLTPDHLIDLYVEDDVVYVELDQSLSRPPRLTAEEALALVMAVRLVGTHQAVQPTLTAVTDKLLMHLSEDDRQKVVALAGRVGVAGSASSETLTLAESLRLAVAERAEMMVEYYSASSDQKKGYTLEPLGLLSHGGMDYLVALDVGADRQEKLFRLDRMGGAARTGKTFSASDDAVDWEKFRTRHLGPSGAPAEVVFSSRVAPVVAERFAGSAQKALKNGGVAVEVTTSSSAFLARWVLPFGLDAEVQSPPEARAAMLELCEQAARVYKDKR